MISKLFNFAWRLNFTGRMIEKTRCTVKDGWQYSKEAQEQSLFWTQAKPSEFADFKIEMDLKTMNNVKTKEELDEWFQSAQPGEIAVYGIANEHRRPPRPMMDHANGYRQRNQVQLFQKKQQNGEFHYLIRKAKQKVDHRNNHR